MSLVEQRMCARHIYARWGKRNSGKELHLQFWIFAWSPNELELRKQLDVMEGLDKGLAANDDLLEHWPVQGWCQAFSLISSNMMLSIITCVRHLMELY